MPLKIKPLAIGMVLVVFLAVLLIPVGYTVEWSADTRLTTNVDIDWSPSVAATNDGKIWVVWRSDRISNNGTIFYKVFDGSSWTEDTMLAGGPSINDYPAVTSTNDGKIWVVWVSDRVGQNENLFYKVFDGVSWSDDTQLTTDPYPDTFPSIMQASDGKIWVVWTSPRFEMQGDIFYKVFDGVSWSEDTRITSDTTTIEEEPSVMQASDGMVWVVFTKIIKQKQKDLYYRVYNGTDWTSDIQLTWDYYHDFDPAITQARDGTIWVVWDSDRNNHDNNIYYKFFDGVWSPDTKLTTHLSDDMCPSIVEAADQTIWIVWGALREFPPNYDIYFRTGVDRHDVAVTNVTTSATLVVRGENVSIQVTVENQGVANETFDVQYYANSTLLGSTFVFLPVGQNATLAPFVWNTTSARGGHYIISAKAVGVPKEIELGDNWRNATDSVEVRIKGDVCGMYNGALLPIPNGVVDLDDFMAIAMPAHMFTEYPTWDPVWGPLCDVNTDGRVSVGDLLECGLHLGET